MSTTTNLGLFKHDNPETNTNQFDVSKALNENWDKVDKNAGEVETKTTALEKDNTTNKTDIANIKQEQVEQNTELEELKADSNNLSTVLDINAFQIGINTKVSVNSHVQHTYRWLIPYKLKPYECVKNIIMGNLNVQNEVQVLVETWKEVDNTIIKTGEQTITIPKNTSTSLEFKTIPFFYNTNENYGYISFKHVDETSKILPYTTSEDISSDLRAFRMPLDGTSFSSSELVRVGSAKLVAMLTVEKSNIIDHLMLEPNKDIIVDIKGKGHYTDIVEAINEANDGDTLLIYPGEYIVPNDTFCNMRTKTLYLKGIDRDTCIIKSYDGRYDYPTIWASSGLIENLSIISEYKEGVSNEIGTENKGSYAIHCEDEYGKDKSFTVSNCYVKSDFAPAIGTGLRKNATFTVKDCELINNQTTERGNNNYGALFFHDSIGEQGHSIVKIINNIMKSKIGWTLRISNSIGGDNTVDCEFLFNTLYDESKGYGSVAVINDAFNTNFTLLPTSRGNNNNNINYISE